MASRYLNNIRINDAYTFPSADGTDGQVITTDGAGALSFADAAASDAIVLTVKNVSGGSLSVGTVVHPSPTASPPSGNVVEVIAADNSAASTMPAIGVLKTTLADDAEGDAIAFGRVSGLDTSSFSAGDSLYVNTSGGFTTTKPTGTALIQKIGIVVKSHASSGTIEVFGANRTNDVPNITEDYIWLGNSSGVATATEHLLNNVKDVTTSSPTDGQVLTWDNANSYWKNADGGGVVNIERNSYTGDGSDLTFDTTSTIDNEVNVQVYVDGVYQSKTKYSTSGSTVTFASGNAPANGAAVELIHHKGDTGATIAANAIDTTQIVDDAVTFDKIEDRYTAVGTITNTSGATTVDWSSAAVYKMNAALTAAIEFDFTNYKAGQVLTIYNLSGSYAVTLDSDAATSESFLKLAEQDYDGSATSMLQVECLADGDDAVFVYSVAQYASDTTI
jgi:hypothetical protein